MSGDLTLALAALGGVVLEPLVAGLKSRGLCFATLREHPEYRSAFATSPLSH